MWALYIYMSLATYTGNDQGSIYILYIVKFHSSLHILYVY